MTHSPCAPRPSVAEEILIVPAAHTRIADVSFQIAMYELFHRTAGGRAGHMIGTPAILLGALLFATRAPGAAAPVLAVALAAAVAAWGAVVDRLAGVLTAVAAALLAALAFAIARPLGPERALVVAVACIAGGCAVQTLSHLFEDVPPPLSGAPAFVPLSAWLGRVRPRDFARAALLTAGVFFWLEMWASLRILPLQILHLLMRAGHRPALRSAVDARVAEILAAPASDWKRPRDRSPAAGGAGLERLARRGDGASP